MAGLRGSGPGEADAEEASLARETRHDLAGERGPTPGVKPRSEYMCMKMNLCECKYECEYESECEYENGYMRIPIHMAHPACTVGMEQSTFLSRGENSLKCGDCWS